MKSLLRSIFVLASLFVSTAACSNDFSGQWTLSVENSEYHVVATLKVKFTNEKAASCMGGVESPESCFSDDAGKGFLPSIRSTFVSNWRQATDDWSQ